MGKIIATVEDELEKKFKKAVIDKYGKLRDHQSKCVEEAIRLWLKDQRECTNSLKTIRRVKNG